MEKDKQERLFDYYVEQTRHTESLRLEFTKFYSGLVSAIAVGGAFLLQNADPNREGVVLGIVAGAGCVFCLLAAATLWTYQRLIREWVAAKNAVERDLLQNEELPELREVRKASIDRPVPVLYVAVLPFLIMSVLFLLLFFFPSLLKVP